MPDEIEHSAFGYWIKPDGTAVAMELLQDHGEWIIRNSIFAARFAAAGEAVAHAVSEGWVAVTFSPIGSSCGIRVRQEAITGRAARALSKVIKESGFEDREVYTDLRSGPGKAVVQGIRASSWNDEEFASPFDAAEDRLKNLNRLRFRGTQMVWAAAALQGGALPDVSRVEAELAAFQEARKQVHENAYGWSASGYKLSTDNDAAGLLEIRSSVRLRIVECAGKMSEATQRAWEALHGVGCRSTLSIPIGFEPFEGIAPGETPTGAITRFGELYDETMDKVKGLGSPLAHAPEAVREPVLQARASILALGLSSTTITGHIRRMDHAISSLNGDDPSKLYRLMSYFLCHECGGSTGGSLPNGKRIKSQLDSVRSAISSLPPKIAP